MRRDMNDFALTEEHSKTAPLNIHLELLFDQGTRVVSKVFSPKEEWDNRDPEERLKEIEVSLKGMSDAVMRQIRDKNLTV
jgi:hypothetical protein